MATRLSDGRYQARVRQPDGTRKPFYGETAQEADALADQERLRLRILSTASEEDAESPTLHSFAKAVWWPRLEFLSGLSREKYESVWKNHVRPYPIASLPIGAIRLQHVQNHLNFLAREGKRDREKKLTGEPLGAKQVEHAKQCMSQVLELAVAERIIPTNPAKLARTPPKPDKRVRVLTISKALEISEGTRGTRLHAPAVLAMVLGMRRGEISAARWSDLDRQGLSLTVHEQIVQERGGTIRKAVKTRAGRRVIPLTPELVEIIDRAGNLDHEYIAGWKGFQWMPPDKITQDWIEVREKFGLEDWHFHDLRHGAASILHQMEVDLITIAAILGHAKIDTSLIYVDSSRKQMRDAMGSVAAAFIEAAKA